jgi:hypothetical protein
MLDIGCLGVRCLGFVRESRVIASELNHGVKDLRAMLPT